MQPPNKRSSPWTHLLIAVLIAPVTGVVVYGCRASKDRVQLESYRYAADRGAIGILFYAMILAVGIYMLALGFLLVRAIDVWRRQRRAIAVAMART